MNFKELVNIKGYNSYTLGKKINRSHSTVSRWMNCVNEPSCEMIVELSKVLKVSIKELVLIFANKKVVDYDKEKER